MTITPFEKKHVCCGHVTPDSAIEITPQMAAEWLANRAPNRSIKIRRVASMTNDILSGRWCVNGETIVFDEKGILIDGQNRLQACVNAGRAIRSIVVTGVRREFAATFDSGTSRSLGDSLQIDGVTNANRVAAALTLVWRYKNRNQSGGLGWYGQPSRSEMQQMLKENPGIEDSSRSIAVSSAITRLVVPSVSTGLHYLFSQYDADATQEFFELLSSGTGLQEGHPVLTLRETLIRSRASKNYQLDPDTAAALMIMAFNKFVRGETVKRLVYYPSRNGFPYVIGDEPVYVNEE